MLNHFRYIVVVYQSLPKLWFESDDYNAIPDRSTDDLSYGTCTAKTPKISRKKSSFRSILGLCWVVTTISSGHHSRFGTTKQLNMMDFVLKMMGFVLKWMDFVLKRMNFVLKIMDILLSMMDWILQMMDAIYIH